MPKFEPDPIAMKEALERAYRFLRAEWENAGSNIDPDECRAVMYAIEKALGSVPSARRLA